VFERFTHRAREVVVLAQEEARMLGHDYIGAEHLLLGLLRAGGSACATLQSAGVTLDETRERVVDIVGREAENRSGQIPFTPRAKEVLESALREALTLEDDNIGDEHLLLGVLRQRDGVAADVLDGFEVDREALAQGIRAGPPRPGPAGVPLRLSDQTMEVLNRAMELARDQGEAEVSPDHLREALGRQDETGV
jgi:ATP-dependent Clp protease ATP-binding subunit ClpC